MGLRRHIGLQPNPCPPCLGFVNDPDVVFSAIFKTDPIHSCCILSRYLISQIFFRASPRIALTALEAKKRNLHLGSDEAIE